MKTFYTERDIEDMHAQGITEIEVDDDVVLTDLAKDKAISLGIKMKRVEQRSTPPQDSGMPRLAVAPQMQLPPVVHGSPISSTPPSAPSPPAATIDPDITLINQIKSAVVTRLGTTQYNDLLDRIIPLVLARLK